MVNGLDLTPDLNGGFKTGYLVAGSNVAALFGPMPQG
jgi:hypothetical protein